MPSKITHIPRTPLPTVMQGMSCVPHCTVYLIAPRNDPHPRPPSIIVIILLLLKEVGSAKLRESDIHPICHSEDHNTNL